MKLILPDFQEIWIPSIIFPFYNLCSLKFMNIIYEIRLVGEYHKHLLSIFTYLQVTTAIKFMQCTDYPVLSVQWCIQHNIICKISVLPIDRLGIYFGFRLGIQATTLQESLPRYMYNMQSIMYNREPPATVKLCGDSGFFSIQYELRCAKQKWTFLLGPIFRRVSKNFKVFISKKTIPVLEKAIVFGNR